MLFSADQNESAPDSMSHGTPVEQPSPEVCSPPAYVLICAVGMAPTGYSQKLMIVESPFTRTN